MGYALFAQRKIVLDGQLNSAQLQQTQRSNEQYKLATDSLSLQQQMTSLTASHSNILAGLYAKLSHVGQEQVTVQDKDGNDVLIWQNKDIDFDDEAQTRALQQERDAIEAQIKAQEQENQSEIDDINRQIYLVGIKETSVEMEVKRLDTMVSALQKQLEAVEEAEGKAIDRATPKFNGVG